MSEESPVFESAPRLATRIAPSDEMDLNQVTVPCSDLEPSVAFYRTLGLRLIVHDPPDYARFECPTGSATFSLHRMRAFHRGTDAVTYFELDDVDAAVRRLLSAGLRFESLPQDQPWLWREAHLRDPDGNRICLYRAGENRRNPPWRIQEPR